jgi:hypothetical protein
MWTNRILSVVSNLVALLLLLAVTVKLTDGPRPFLRQNLVFAAVLLLTLVAFAAWHRSRHALIPVWGILAYDAFMAILVLFYIFGWDMN